MSAIDKAGRSFDGIGIKGLDRAHAVRPNESRTVAGSDLNSNQFEYKLDVFDRDGDGRADAVVLTGKQTADRFGRPSGEAEHRIVNLYGNDGRFEARYTVTADNRVKYAQEMIWGADGKALYRSESDANLDGAVDGRSEGTAEVIGTPSGGSGINMALAAEIRSMGAGHLATAFRITDISTAIDRNKDGKLTPDEVDAPGLRAPDSARRDPVGWEAARQVAARRIAAGEKP